MSKYIIRRLIGIPITLLVIIAICFFMIRLAPGGPFDAEKALPRKSWKIWKKNTIWMNLS